MQIARNPIRISLRVNQLAQLYTEYDMIATASSTDTLDHEAVRKARVELGRRIAGARTYHQLSQDVVARVAETTSARISAIENATGDARIGTILRVAQAVGLELSLQESDA